MPVGPGGLRLVHHQCKDRPCRRLSTPCYRVHRGRQMIRFGVRGDYRAARGARIRCLGPYMRDVNSLVGGVRGPAGAGGWSRRAGDMCLLAGVLCNPIQGSGRGWHGAYVSQRPAGEDMVPTPAGGCGGPITPAGVVTASVAGRASDGYRAWK